MKSQSFGIEIETTGIGCENTAKAIAADYGTTARHIGRHLDDWQLPMPDGRHWTVERDSSVTDPSAEVVSPVCRCEDIGMVQEVVRAMRMKVKRVCKELSYGPECLIVFSNKKRASTVTDPSKDYVSLLWNTLVNTVCYGVR